MSVGVKVAVTLPEFAELIVAVVPVTPSTPGLFVEYTIEPATELVTLLISKFASPKVLVIAVTVIVGVALETLNVSVNVVESYPAVLVGV